MRPSAQIIISGFFAMVLCCTSVVAKEISFRYGIIGQNDDSKNFIIEKGEVFKSGDLLKLNFEYPNGAWFYVCYLSSDDEYALVYSSGGVAVGEAETVYETLGWLALDDHTGVETFILIVSTGALSRLEELFVNYDRASGKSRKRFHKRLTRQLEDLEKELAPKADFGLAPRLEKPVIGGVTFRGVADAGVSENTLSHEASGSRLAVAVFAIRHQ